MGYLNGVVYGRDFKLHFVRFCNNFDIHEYIICSGRWYDHFNHMHYWSLRANLQCVWMNCVRILSNSQGYGSILIFTEEVHWKHTEVLVQGLKYWHCLHNRCQVYKEENNKTVKLWSYLLNLNDIFLCQGKRITRQIFGCERHDSPIYHGHETSIKMAIS